MEQFEFDHEELHKLLTSRFSDSELRTLCFYLRVDYENLGGDAQADKARELILYLERNNRLHDLFIKGSNYRPDINWQGILQSNFPSDNLILINGNIENFSLQKHQIFLHILTSILNIGMEEIYISAFDPNSTKVILDLSELARKKIEGLPTTSRTLLKQMGIFVRELLPSSERKSQSISFADSVFFNKSSHHKSPAVVNWDIDSHTLFLDVKKIWSKPFPIQLQFANRIDEKKNIKEKIYNLKSIQVIASGGLGKTYLLNRINRELEQEPDYKTVWFDFLGEDKDCIANHSKFLDSFYTKLSGNILEPIGDDNNKIRTIVREMANHKEQIILFIDNADCANWKLSKWIRGVFLRELQVSQIVLPVIGSAQEEIPEWAGISGNSPLFSTVSLSGFKNFQIITEILSNVIEVFGSPRSLKIKQEMDEKQWTERLDSLSLDILKMSRGHPLVIAELINYIYIHDGFINEKYCTHNQEKITKHVLSPIAGGRILPKIEAGNSVRQAFESLCVFRYLWLGLIKKLCQANDLDYWNEFSSADRDHSFWWPAIQKTSLIQAMNYRVMFPISPTERQIIAMVLKDEDIDLYHARNTYARDVFESLVYSKKTSLLQRATYFVEMLFHMTQDGTSNSESILNAIQKYKNTYENTVEEYNEMYALIYKWLRLDHELKERVTDLTTDPKLYGQIIDAFE